MKYPAVNSKSLFFQSVVIFVFYSRSFISVSEMLLEVLPTGMQFTYFRFEMCASQLLLTSVEVKVKVKFTLEQATKAQRWSRGIAVLFSQPRR